MDISKIIHEALREERKEFMKEISHQGSNTVEKTHHQSKSNVKEKNTKAKESNTEESGETTQESTAETRDGTNEILTQQEDPTTTETTDETTITTTFEPPQKIEIFIQQPSPTTATPITSTAVKSTEQHTHKNVNKEQESAQEQEDPLFGNSSDVFSDGQTSRLKGTQSKSKVNIKKHQTNDDTETKPSNVDLVEEIKRIQEHENEKLENRIDSKLQQVLKSTQERIKNITLPTTITTTPKSAGTSKLNDLGKDHVIEELKGIVKNLTKGRLFLNYHLNKLGFYLDLLLRIFISRQ